MLGNFDRPTRATQTIQLAFEDSAAALHIVCLAQILIRLDNLVAHAKRQVGYQLTTVPGHYYHLTTMLTFLYLIIYAVNEGSHVYVACVQHGVLLGLARLLAGIIYIYYLIGWPVFFGVLIMVAFAPLGKKISGKMQIL